MNFWSDESSLPGNGLYDRWGSAAPPAWLDAEQKQRWEKLRQCRMLYEGQHRRFFLAEGRTQFRYPEEFIGGRKIQRYLTFNLCRLVANTTADLLLGRRASLVSPDPGQQDEIDQLSRRSFLHSRLHEAAVQMAWAGGAFLEAIVWRGQSYIDLVNADEIYPLGTIQPDGQYGSYVRFAVDQIADVADKKTALLRTEYLPGQITRKLSWVDDRGQIGETVDLSRWPAFGGDVPPPVQPTGIEANTITYLANRAGDRIGVSAFDGLVCLQDAVNAKLAQVARVIEKHADPKLRVPRAAADANGNFPAGADVVFADAPEEYGYITWEAQLDAALRDRQEAVLAFCAAAEMSPVLLGIRQGATPDAARKLRLEATKDLAKTARTSLLIEPAIARAIQIALELEQTTAARKSFALEPVGVGLRDGLPTDPLDDAQEVSLYRSAGVMSIHDAVALRVDDPAAAAAEEQRLEAEHQATIPPVLLGEPPADGAAENGGGQ